jgi:5'-3' exonuclease
MLLVDGSSVLHRCLNTPAQDLQDSRGRYTGGLHSFLASLSKAVVKHRLRHSVVVAWDLGVPLFRRLLYREYKAHKMPIGSVQESVLSDYNLLNKEAVEEDESDWMKKYLMARRLLHSQFLPLSGCLSIQVANCEADDIIAYVCSKLPDEEIIVYSSDRDLVQLCTDNIEYYDGREDTTITKSSLIFDNELVEVVWRQHWVLTRAIAGDGSDGIPGFCGFDTAKKYSDQIISFYLTNVSLQETLLGLIKPPRARNDSFEKIKVGADMIMRNYNLMDLSYPIIRNLSIIEDIKQQIAGAFIYDIDQYTLESELHDMSMVKAKIFVNNIIESNRKNDVKDYIRKLI